ncbi:DUF2934 domain-containing protein [Mesorhizobium sp. BR1-1-16]|uniref:DUF2934 domain-containing protein n=1 Tax=Mesorhizobium sp. BR1-1-16 TaxID=2876653 RepID=UPI001CCA3BCF|nr:DUF2934 domain-containing protein [Mesorhizobium sp. BR1-1-16]MBZ9936980.1 DUF2934 domain-containing protein [Mesorhizobium sp. BR1-1-16]
MTEFSDSEIAAEAYRLWQADGSPVWGHPQDHWFRAIESLRARSPTPDRVEEAGPVGALPARPPLDDLLLPGSSGEVT